MFENNGTTPAQQDSTTPSTTEQYLTLAEAVTKVTDLEAKLADMTNSRDGYWDLFRKLSGQVEKAEEAFKEILAGDTDASSIIETYGEVLAEHLGWSFTREVEIELSVTWRGTIQLPHGVEVGDLDIDDFGIEINGHNEYESDISYYFHDSDISER